MKTNKIYLLGLLMAVILLSTEMYAQCDTWNGADNMDELTDAHTVYRGLIKSEDYASAEEYWQKVYDAAPAADGKRDFHFTDGAKIYINKYKNAADDAQKKEYADKAISFYNEAVACYEAGTLSSKRGKEAAIATLYSKMGYDMYYSLRSPYSKVMEAYEKSLELAGDDASYGIVTPLATVAVYQFQKGLIDKAKALEVYEKLTALCSNKEGHKYQAYYDQALGAMKGEYDKVKKEVFDCEYFIQDFQSRFGDDPNAVDYEKLKSIIVSLKRQGCTGSEPYLAKFESVFKQKTGAINAQKQATFEANNPGLLAKKAYDAGDFDGAIAKYNEAIANESNAKQKASYHFSIASILFRKKKSYSAARAEARKAMQVRPDWGRPYSLLGDMYSTTARNCGDSWNQSLAVLAAIAKWKKAISLDLDANVAQQTRKKISTYNQSKPLKEDGFMQGIKAGDKQKVGCWIGETVSVSYR